MVSDSLTGIKLEKTDEPLTGRGGMVAFGEYVRGMKVRERVHRWPPAPAATGGSLRRSSWSR